MIFEFATAGRIIFGPGTLKQIGPLAGETGSRAFVVLGQSLSRAQPLLALLDRERIKTITFQVPGEPTIDLIQQGAILARESESDLVIGFGGGSVVDAGKAIAALATNKEKIEDYLEVIGQSRPLTSPPLPYFAVPTTAGTGAEVTRNAVLASPEHKVKVSLRSPLMLPKVAVIDPTLTCSLSPQITAATGLDALTQLIEPLVSLKANPMTDILCREGVSRVANSLRKAYEEGTNATSRQDMALASLFGGLALANAGLGAVHGLAAPIGGMFPAPHGLVCARLLPWVMAANIRALQERSTDSPALKTYDQIAVLLTRKEGAKALEGVEWVQETCTRFNIPVLARFGVTAEILPELIQKAAGASSMKGNPIQLTAQELRDILVKALT